MNEADSVSKLVERVEHPRKLQNSNMRGQKKNQGEDVSSTTTEDEEEDENDNSKSGAISSKKPRKDSGVHSMNSSSSTVASDKDIGVSRCL